MAETERRRHKRVQTSANAAMRVISLPKGTRLKDRTYFCKTEDVSSGGLQCVISDPIPVGTLLDISISMERPSGTYRHIGKVVWSKHLKPKEHAIGLEITDTPSMFSPWSFMVEQALEQ